MKPPAARVPELDDRGGTLSTGRQLEPKKMSLDRPKLPSNVVKSAGRALQILEYFDDVQGAASVIEVARALGFPQSSASMLLRSLVALGYLHYDPSDRTYQPTSRVGLLGSWVEPYLLRGGALVELMRNLNGATGDTVILAARNGLQSQYIHIEQAATALDIWVPVGATRPIATSVTGLIFMTALSDLEVAKLVRRINAYAQFGEPLVRASELNETLKQIRRDGYAFRTSRFNAGTSLLAVPLRSQVTRYPLALALAGPTERMEKRLNFLLDAVRARLAGHFNDGTQLDQTSGDLIAEYGPGDERPRSRVAHEIGVC